MFDEQVVRERMDKTIENFHQRIDALQLDGEVTPEMLRSIRVFAYGSQCTLEYMAMVVPQDEDTIIVEPFDKSQSSAIGRALTNCAFSLKPWKDRDRWIVHIEMPSREEIDRRLKYLNTIGEEQKVAIRQIRREFRKKWDECDADLDRLTKEYADRIDAVLEQYIKPKPRSPYWQWVHRRSWRRYVDRNGRR